MLLRYLPLVFASGCFLIPPEEKSDDSRSGFHDVTVKWHLRKNDGSLLSACPPGFTTVVTHLYVVGFVEPPDALIQTPCTPEGSITQPVATAGELLDPESADSTKAYYDYHPEKDIWVDITEQTQTTYLASSFYFHTEVTANQTIDFDIYPEGGIGVAAWELTSAANGAPLPKCQDAGVDEIEYAYRPYGDETAPLVVGGSWPCSQIDPYFYYDPDGNSTLIDKDAFQAGSGHTKGLAPMSYYIELRAKRAGVVVGKSVDASLNGDSQNIPHRIHSPIIPIDGK